MTYVGKVGELVISRTAHLYSVFTWIRVYSIIPLDESNYNILLGGRR
jgi:hypothetical protein